MPGLQEVTQVLAVLCGHQLLHKGDNRQDLARVAEEAEAKQVPLPQAAQVTIAIDAPRPALGIEKEAQPLLRDGTNHVKAVHFELCATRGDSFHRFCVATAPLFHIGSGVVRRDRAARRLLAVGSTVSIRPP